MNTALTIILSFAIGFALPLAFIKVSVFALRKYRWKPVQLEDGLSLLYLGGKTQDDIGDHDLYIVRTDGRPLDSWLISKQK